MRYLSIIIQISQKHADSEKPYLKFSMLQDKTKQEL